MAFIAHCYIVQLQLSIKIHEHLIHAESLLSDNLYL